jgi:nodulation protein E
VSSAIVVSGMGCITAAGLGWEQLWRACVDGVSFSRLVRPPSASPNVSPPEVAMAAVSDEVVAEALSTLDPALIKRPTRHIKCALAAVADLVSGIRGDIGGPRAGVIWGSGTSTLRPIEEGYEALFFAGKSRVSPLTVSNSMVSAPAGAIARLLGLRGASFSVGSACASSAHAISVGAALLRAGILDRVIVGGSEVLLDHGAISAWTSTGVVSRTRCRPFHRNRNGILLGEGAAALLLEREKDAAAAGRPVLARLRGSGWSTGETELMSPDPAAVRAVMDQVREALHPADRVVMNCHATGTRAGDEVEAASIAEAFADYAGELRVGYTKHVTGHTMSASGALEAVISIANLQKDDTTVIDEELDDVFAPRFRAPLSARPDVAVSNSFGFGGMNCALIFERAL